VGNVFSWASEPLLLKVGYKLQTKEDANRMAAKIVPKKKAGTEVKPVLGMLCVTIMDSLTRVGLLTNGIGLPLIKPA